MAAGKKAGKHAQQSNDFLEPYVPTDVSATDVGTARAYDNGAANVSFTPAPTGPVATSYTVTSYPDGYTATGTSSPILIEGLKSNTSYTFAVKANNEIGSSINSLESASVLITTVPQAPAAPSASSPSAGQDYISWSTPNNGGKAITGYHWESNDGKTGDTGANDATISQEQGTAQTYKLYATNANGNSVYSSDSSSVTTTFSFVPFSVFGFFSVFNFFSVFEFFSVFGFFSVFEFFSVFGFFSVFTFFSVFGFFSVFTFFSVFGFSPFRVFGFSPISFKVFGFSPVYVARPEISSY